MISTNLLQAITEETGIEQLTYEGSVSGGDINEAYQLKNKDGLLFFLKCNTNADALKMFEAEANGLRMLHQFGQLTPKVLAVGQSEDTAFLLLNFIVSAAPTPAFWKRFGQQLAQLHKTFSDEFGLDHDNFIGRLPQDNYYAYDWDEFYLKGRLEPQVKMAIERDWLTKLDLEKTYHLASQLSNICPDEPPALIHGDLWNGNFLCDQNQQPVLIDPAISFAHREMDLAMTRLFGGFDPLFYQAYEETYPLQPGFKDRLEVYQLYYLLVHVNLFGYSYVASVRRILDRYYQG